MQTPAASRDSSSSHRSFGARRWLASASMMEPTRRGIQTVSAATHVSMTAAAAYDGQCWRTKPAISLDKLMYYLLFDDGVSRGGRRGTRTESTRRIQQGRQTR